MPANYYHNNHCVCGKLISDHAKKCGTCACKEKLKNPKNNPNYKTGIFSDSKPKCPKCGKELYYQSETCSACNKMGELNPFFGKHHTDETKQKIVKNRRSYSGKNNPNYVDGTSNHYSFDFLKLRDLIRVRDNYTCQNCGMTEEEHLTVIGKNLHVHHIDYNKKNNVEDNLITLCNWCNIRANKNKNYWKETYTNKILGVIHVR